MSEARSIGFSPAGGSDVRAAIARAAQATGVDFDYLLAQARIESSLDPAARAPTSSAAGLYQFTSGTWLATLDRHGGEHGLAWAGAAIQGGRVADPAMRAQIMALRHDPQASALMAAELANDNRAALSGQLGREPDAAELYLAHFLGAGGAGQFLAALQSDPGQSAAALMPKPAAANRGIFFSRDGAPRSVAGVMEVLRAKVIGALERGEGESLSIEALPAAPLVQPSPQPASGGPIARQFHAAALQGASSFAPQRSMAETLRTTFAASADTATDTGAGAPAFVRAAYGQLARFGL